ncbi:PRTRC system protein B [Emticicia fontis]
MSNQKDITKNFETTYHPVSALVFFQSEEVNEPMYVEHYDIGPDGKPINAHPLTVIEAQKLVNALDTDKKEVTAFLRPKGIMPLNVLHYNLGKNGCLLWYTKAQKRQLFFSENLGIRNGQAFVPSMLWSATKDSLSVYAIDTNKRPTGNTQLYQAPFFNVFQDARVCMGTVNVQIQSSASVEEFMTAWENYFFNSYFSHFNNNSPTKGNSIALWKELILTGKAFPIDQLVKNNKKVKNLLQ